LILPDKTLDTQVHKYGKRKKKVNINRERPIEEWDFPKGIISSEHADSSGRKEGRKEGRSNKCTSNRITRVDDVVE